MERAKTRLFLRYFAPFALLVCVIAMLSSAWLYWRTRAQTIEEVDALLINSVESAADCFENQFLEMERIVYNLAAKSDFRPYSVFLNPYVHTKVGGEISSYMSANSCLDDVILYYGDTVASAFGESALFLSKSGVHEAESSWNYLYRIVGMEYDDFVSFADGLRAPAVFPRLENKNVYNMAKAHMAYVVPNGEGSAIIILVDLNRFSNLFSSELSYNGGSLRVWDKNGSMLLSISHSSGQDAPFDVEQAIPKDTPLRLDAEGGAARIAYRSSLRGWTFVIDWSENPYMRLYHSVMRIQAPFLALILFGGISIALWVSRFAFRPIAKIYDSVAAYARKPLVFSFEGMVESLKEMEGHWDALKYQMEQQRELCHLQVINDILKGRYHYDREIRDLLLNNELDLAGDIYVVYAIHTLPVVKADGAERSGHSYARYFEKCGVADGEKRCAMPTDQMDIYALVCSLPRSADPVAHAEALFASLREGLNSVASIAIGASDPSDSLSGIAGAYAEATTALQFEFLFGHDRLIRIEDVRESSDKEIVWYPVQIEALMSQALSAGCPGVVREQLEALGNMLRGMRAPYNVARSILSSMIRRMADNLREANETLSEANLISIEHLFSNRSVTLDEILNRMCAVLTDACEKVAATREDGQEALSSRVDAYLRASLTNDTLSLLDVANEFHMSAGYLSRLYKHETGNTVIQALDEFRLVTAYELVRNTDLTLSDILARCGYVDKGNFIRKYKKNFGITPMRCREIYRNTGLT